MPFLRKKKRFVPSSTQLTRKPPIAALKPMGRPSFPGYGYELVRTLHDGLPYMEGHRATD